MNRLVLTLRHLRKLTLIFLVIASISHLIQLFIIPAKINSQLEPYYRSFLTEAHTRNKGLIKHFKVTLEFAPMDGKNLGMCRNVMGLQPLVQINPTHWQKLNHFQKEMVVYHELAHCLLLKGHGIHGIPHNEYTLMSKRLFSETDYIMNREAYLQELFGYKSYHITSFVVTFFKLETPAKKLFGIELTP